MNDVCYKSLSKLRNQYRDSLLKEAIHFFKRATEKNLTVTRITAQLIELVKTQDEIVKFHAEEVERIGWERDTFKRLYCAGLDSTNQVAVEEIEYLRNTVVELELEARNAEKVKYKLHWSLIKANGKMTNKLSEMFTKLIEG